MQDPLFESVVVCARKLTLAYQRLNQSKLSTPIALNPDPAKGWYSGPARPNGCINAAEQFLKKKIEVLSFPPLGLSNPIAAHVQIYGDRAEIFISSAQNYCWRRLLVAKELAHLLICEPGNQTPINPAAVTSLLSDLINNVGAGANPILQVEVYAYYAAIEILLPMEHAIEASQKFSAGQSLLDLAKEYRIPRQAMEFRLTEPSAMRLYEELYASQRFKNLPYDPING
jgi:Zn-dependent peptidase ImmA (M78 family)